MALGINFSPGTRVFPCACLLCVRIFFFNGSPLLPAGTVGVQAKRDVHENLHDNSLRSFQYCVGGSYRLFCRCSRCGVTSKGRQRRVYLEFVAGVCRERRLRCSARFHESSRLSKICLRARYTAREKRVEGKQSLVVGCWSAAVLARWMVCAWWSGVCMACLL